MDLQHHGNWPPVGELIVESDPPFTRRVVYQCPLCFALTSEPMDHAQFHAWTRTDHPYATGEQ